MNTISPVPDKSPIADKEFKVSIDWIRWFRDASSYILRILNRYDATKSGVATLIGGTVVIANTTILASSYLRLTAQNVSGTAGHLSIVLNPGVGFTINSSNALDTRTIFYEIVEAF